MHPLGKFEYIDYSLTLVDDIKFLASPYLIGDFNSCEVNEVFCFSKNTKIKQIPVNVYTLIVFEKSHEPPSKPEWLTQNHFAVKGLKDWAFGIQRSRITLETLYAKLDELFKCRTWILTASNLDTGSLTALPRKFVPAEAESIPVNMIIKNNFWNGSYIFELFAQDKGFLQHFIDATILLQDLSKKMRNIYQST